MIFIKIFYKLQIIRLNFLCKYFDINLTINNKFIIVQRKNRVKKKTRVRTCYKTREKERKKEKKKKQIIRDKNEKR